MAYSELMIRLRSSLRCSKNVIWPPASSSRVMMELSDWLLLVMRGGFFRGSWFFLFLLFGCGSVRAWDGFGHRAHHRCFLRIRGSKRLGQGRGFSRISRWNGRQGIFNGVCYRRRGFRYLLLQFGDARLPFQVPN